MTDAVGRLGGLAPDGPDEMGRELAEGPRAVAETLTGLAARRDDLATLVAGAPRVQLVGTGASLAMARTAAGWIRGARNGGPVLVRESSTALFGAADGEAFLPGDLAVLVSQSGTSPETVAVARVARAARATTLAITAAADGPLAREAQSVIDVRCGPEGGAATKSELASLAALAALARALDVDADAIARLRAALRAIVDDTAPAAAAGAFLARSRVAWLVGFGAGYGVALAGSMLLHEKALLPCAAMTPSGFRHGPIEAATPRDAVVAIELDAPDEPRATYLARLARELGELGVPLIAIGFCPAVVGPGAAIPVAGAPGAEAALEGLLRLQQAARATAHVRGTYMDGFRILRRVVAAADDLAAGP